MFIKLYSDVFPNAKSQIAMAQIAELRLPNKHRGRRGIRGEGAREWARLKLGLCHVNFDGAAVDLEAIKVLECRLRRRRRREGHEAEAALAGRVLLLAQVCAVLDLTELAEDLAESLCAWRTRMSKKKKRDQARSTAVCP
jgi:hypothetical protein